MSETQRLAARGVHLSAPDRGDVSDELFARGAAMSGLFL
jgi:hypothetical protein